MILHNSLASKRAYMSFIDIYPFSGSVCSDTEAGDLSVACDVACHDHVRQCLSVSTLLPRDKVP